MCRFAAERMTLRTAESRCAAAPGGGGEVCRIINPTNNRRYIVDGATDPNGCSYNEPRNTASGFYGIRAPPPPPHDRGFDLTATCDLRAGRSVVERVVHSARAG